MNCLAFAVANTSKNVLTKSSVVPNASQQYFFLAEKHATKVLMLKILLLLHIRVHWQRHFCRMRESGEAFVYLDTNI